MECKCYFPEGSGQRQIVKCPLCKAAPDMYKACKEALAGMSETSSMRRRVTARKQLQLALAKADKGE